MPDKVEQIMKKIHVLFAKSDDYNGSPDKVVISRKEMFDILEELNVAIYEVLDQYEATTRSKEKARLEMERMAAGIISDAKKAAEDVNAASLIYTDTMIEEIRSILAETTEIAKNQLEELKSRLDERMELLVENKDEVKSKLNELHENEFYLKVLDEKRRKDAEGLKSVLKDIEDIEEDDEPQEETIKHADYVIKVNEAYLSKKPGDKKQEETDSDTAAAFAYGEPHVNPDDFDLDSEYYQWKEEQEVQTGQDTENKKPKRFFFGRKKDN